MTPVREITGIAAPLLTPDIDTEVIIRVSRVMEFEKGELGPYAFEPLRYAPDGAENPDFILNRVQFEKASILVAGENFGCGSSREAAVWAIGDRGIRCILAQSFGDIFAQNCLQNGILTVILARAEIDAIAGEIDLDSPKRMTIDLAHCQIQTPAGRLVPFEIEPERRRMLMEGLDEISATLELDDQITAHQAQQQILMPWVDLSSSQNMLRL
jgi:3-isopropylmalate/(R)-2-methylmalate dehydratase small subunit